MVEKVSSRHNHFPIFSLEWQATEIRKETHKKFYLNFISLLFDYKTISKSEEDMSWEGTFELFKFITILNLIVDTF